MITAHIEWPDAIRFALARLTATGTKHGVRRGKSGFWYVAPVGKPAPVLGFGLVRP